MVLSVELRPSVELRDLKKLITDNQRCISICGICGKLSRKGRKETNRIKN